MSDGKRMYRTETITLQDGTEVVLKPAVIGRLRRLMDAWSKFGDVETDDEGFTVFVNCSGIGLEENFKGKFDAGLKASKEEKEADPEQILSTEYKEYLEETLDLDSIYKILDVCGGIKLNDPKLLEAVQGLELDGEN